MQSPEVNILNKDKQRERSKQDIGNIISGSKSCLNKYRKTCMECEKLKRMMT